MLLWGHDWENNGDAPMRRVHNLNVAECLRCDTAHLGCPYFHRILSSRGGRNETPRPLEHRAWRKGLSQFISVDVAPEPLRC